MMEKIAVLRKVRVKQRKVAHEGMAASVLIRRGEVSSRWRNGSREDEGDERWLRM